MSKNQAKNASPDNIEFECAFKNQTPKMLLKKLSSNVKITFELTSKCIAIVDKRVSFGGLIVINI